MTNKLDQATARMVEIDHELQLLADRPEWYKSEIREARAASLRQAPAAPSGAPGSKAHGLHKQQEEDERRVQTLTEEREALELVVRELMEKHTKALLEKAVARAAQVRKTEHAAYTAAGALFGQLVAIYDDQIVPCIRELEQIRDDVTRQGVDGSDVQALYPVVQPVPNDGWSFVGMLWAASADPGGRGLRDPSEPTAQRSDKDSVLVPLTPDLRGRERHSFRHVEMARREFRA